MLYHISGPVKFCTHYPFNSTFTIRQRHHPQGLGSFSLPHVEFHTIYAINFCASLITHFSSKTQKGNSNCKWIVKFVQTNKFSSYLYFLSMMESNNLPDLFQNMQYKHNASESFGTAVSTYSGLGSSCFQHRSQHTIYFQTTCLKVHIGN